MSERQMDDFEQTKPCWGVALRAVAVFAGVVAFTAALSPDDTQQVAENTAPAAVLASQ